MKYLILTDYRASITQDAYELYNSRTEGMGGGRIKALSVGSMVLGEDINDDEPTNLVSAAKKASYGLATDVRLAARRPAPPPPEDAEGVASLLPVVLLAADIVDSFLLLQYEF